MTGISRRALVVAIALSGLLGACGGDTESAVTAAPTTAAATPTTMTPAPTPTALVDRWVGPPRTIGNLGTGTAAAFVDISSESLEYDTGIAENPKAFNSDVFANGADLIEIRLNGDVLECRDGDVGHYRWGLSRQATTLTLTAVDDACADRQSAIEGKWTHTACKMQGRDCLGIVEAGTYSTNRWNPYGGFTYGEATFTLPEGWAVTYDSQAALFLGHADDYSKSVSGDPEPAWGLRSWADVAAPLTDCSHGPTDKADPSVGLGAANIAAWMTALPTVEATRSTMTLGGLPAEVVDLQIKDGAATCQGLIVLIVSRTSKPGPFNYGVVAGQHMRIVLVDVLPQRTVAICLDDSGHPGFATLEEAAMPIVTSFVFSPSPPKT
jgi:hypothetical protein